MNPVPAPVFKAYPRQGGILRIVGQYQIDTDPADMLKVWVGLTLPDVNVDVPALTISVLRENFVFDFGLYNPGTYYVVARLFRSSDSALSPTVQAQVVFQAAPDMPTPC